MNEHEITIHIKVSRRTFVWAAAALLMCCSANEVVCESLTMTTYYPAPTGTYQRLVTTGGTVSNPVNTILARDAGNIGIGSANPGQKLEVLGNVSASGRFQAPGGGDVTIGFNSTNKLNLGGVVTVLGSGNVGIGTAAPGGRLDVEGAGGVILNAGSVGIGTAAPLAKLDVAGSVRIADGSQGLGKVLTSDTKGRASWKSVLVGPNISSGESDCPSGYAATGIQISISNNATFYSWNMHCTRLLAP